MLVGTTHVGHASPTFILLSQLTTQKDSLFKMQNSDPENHTLFSSTYPPTPYEGVPPPPGASCLQETQRVTVSCLYLFQGHADVTLDIGPTLGVNVNQWQKQILTLGFTLSYFPYFFFLTFYCTCFTFNLLYYSWTYRLKWILVQPTWVNGKGCKQSFGRVTLQQKCLNKLQLTPDNSNLQGK